MTIWRRDPPPPGDYYVWVQRKTGMHLIPVEERKYNEPWCYPPAPPVCDVVGWVATPKEDGYTYIRLDGMSKMAVRTGDLTPKQIDAVVAALTETTEFAL